MPEVTVIIPNYNGRSYLEICLAALERQTFSDKKIIVVDNGSADGSAEWVRRQYPQAEVLALEKNYGFCGAVNRGVQAADSPYVLLLNNDTEPEPEFVEQLVAGIRSQGDVFSCQAKLLDYWDRERIDDAGDYYCALGWAFARGKGQPKARCRRQDEIFAACGGAAIYRRAVFQELGGLDERHFAYLEDIDLGYRARIQGYRNLFVPRAQVYHVGSATTGSRYNGWKVRIAARNSLYLAYKNMPLAQLILNGPLLLLGIILKILFFGKKHLGKAYLQGVIQGFSLCKREYKVPYQNKNWKNYCKIQLELWRNIGFRLRKF